MKEKETVKKIGGLAIRGVGFGAVFCECTLTTAA